LELGEFKQTLLESADAIDAVLCAFVAKAVSNGELATHAEAFDDEGVWRQLLFPVNDNHNSR
jgi:hypothetical protein